MARPHQHPPAESDSHHGLIGPTPTNERSSAITPPSRWAAIEMMLLLSAAGWILSREVPPTKDPNGLGQRGARALASEGISGAWRGSESLHRRFSRFQVNAPMVFEANHGQTHSSVEMLARGRGYTSFFTSRQIVVAMETDKRGSRPAVRMELVGANPAPRIRGAKPLPGRSHYLLGNDPQQWRTHIRHYAGVRYQQVYPGVELVCYGSDGRLEYDFVISPGGEPSSIRLAFEGADGLSVDPSGDLVVEIGGEQLRHRKPRIYQVAVDRRQPVQGGFVLAGQAEVAFWVGAYDPARTLVIDPVLDYSTYVGGSFADDNTSLTVDRFGNAFVIAEVFSADFPTTDGRPTTSPPPQAHSTPAPTATETSLSPAS